MYVRGLVFDLRDSFDSGLIQRSRNRNWGSRTTHKDRTRWLTRLYASLRGLPTGKIFLQSSTPVISLTAVLDQLRFTDDLNIDFRPDEVVSTSSLQEVDHLIKVRIKDLLTKPKRIFHTPLFLALVWTMITVIGIWTVGFFFANMLQCYPISENWTGLGGTAGTCIDENMMYVGQAFSDAITDLIILAMPIPCVSFPIYYV